MKLLATRVELFLFDSHVYVDPLQNKDLLKSDFRFLVEQEAYDSFYEQQTGLKLGGGELRPLNKNERNKNHFWKYFGKRSSQLGPWLRHLPLIYDVSEEVTFVLDEPPLRGKVVPRILLWPWGWSCRLTCTLDGPLDDEALRRVVRCQGSKNTELGTFEVAGNRMKCNEVFRRMSIDLAHNIFNDDDSVSDSLRVTRQFVLAIHEIRGVALPYESCHLLGLPRLSEADRAALHSVLLGREVVNKELLAREKREPKQFMYSTFGGGAFGLTDFDKGTILYLPNLIGGRKERGSNVKHCLAANIECCSHLTLGLTQMLSDSVGAEEDPIIELARSAEKNLERMANKGANNFNKGFVTKSQSREYLP